MTLLAERPATTESTRTTADRVADTAPRGGSYVTLLAGSAVAPVAGTYVTAVGSLRPVTRGSYVTVGGTPTVSAGTVEGSYVTLPAAA
ncbi:hypothetical protein SAMN04489743_1387 [Pseudarthrobacter equi]|uniref:Uncharacterized protein n=1 Tax=Pseudarthrobacter equi TaxID=728066 RepID=A0A1H1WN02_9MICC|nr:hypothetical protein [Pseudarthrobacter equi]SDS98647.1 hypothetical protein SAMN04489743_1387 [Pseudarthrobacter equi]